MTPNLIITPAGGVEIVVTYDPVQTAYGDLQGNVGGFDNRLVRSDGNTGAIVQGSGATLDDLGNLQIGGNLDIGGNATVPGNLSVNGNLSAPNSNLTVVNFEATGSAEVGGNLSVDGSIFAPTSNVSVGDTTVAGSLTVNADANILGDLTASNASLIVASAQVNSSLNVSGATDLSTLQTSGSATIGSNLIVNGDLTAANASLQVASVQSAGVVTASGFALSPGSPPYVALTSNANGDANEVSCYVKADGTTFTAGQAVYISSVNGQNKIISKAQANNELSSSRTLGLLKQNLVANAFGYVVTQGLLTGLDITVASTVSEGDPVWLSPTVAGGLVFGETNKPSSPNHLVYLGVVVKKNGSTKVNQIEVKVQNSNELAELSDVKLTNPATNNFLIYNGTSGIWENKTANQAATIIQAASVAKSVYATPLISSSNPFTVFPTVAPGSNSTTYKNVARLDSGVSTYSHFVGFKFPIPPADFLSMTSWKVTFYVLISASATYTSGTINFSTTFCRNDFPATANGSPFTIVPSSIPSVPFSVPNPPSVVGYAIEAPISFPVQTTPLPAGTYPTFLLGRTSFSGNVLCGVVGATFEYYF